MSFSLVYGSDVVLPIELEISSKQVEDFSQEASKKGRGFQLDTIKELKGRAKIQQAAQKRRVEAKHLSRVFPREFKEKDLVLRKAGEINKDNKLAPHWIGPYRICEVVGRAAYHLETLDGGVIPQT